MFYLKTSIFISVFTVSGQPTATRYHESTPAFPWMDNILPVTVSMHNALLAETTSVYSLAKT